MKKSGKIAFTVAAVMAVSMFLATCGTKEPKTLEEYIDKNQGDRDMIDAIVEGEPNASVIVKDSTMEIIYRIEEDVDYTKEDLDKGLEGLDETFSGIIKDLEEKTGINGIIISVRYEDRDGKEITSKLFE